MANRERHRLTSLLTLFFALVLSGCATTGGGDPRDPAEGMNRAIYAVNNAVDTAVLKPVAQGYDTVMPAPIKTGIANFFGNIKDLSIAVNNLLQGKITAAISDTGRVLVNSTLGLLGFIDWASDWGMQKHDEDFGQTFGRWGVGDGPYLMLPLLGPSNLRDAVGKVLDIKADPITYVNPEATRYQLSALRLIDTRTALLPADKVINEAALDKYAYLRDAYLQRRRNLVYDGNPPRQAEE